MGISLLIGLIASYHFNSASKFDKQVSSVVKLRHLSKVKASPDAWLWESNSHFYYLSCLNYCNSYMLTLTSHFIIASGMCKMQKFAFWQKRNDVITYTLVTLAPYADFEIQLKFLLHVSQSQSFSTTLLNWTFATLQSCQSTDVYEPTALRYFRFKLNSRGDRAFLVVAPHLLFNLAFRIRADQPLNHFKMLLKTYFF